MKKDWKLFPAVIKLEEAYDRDDRKSFRDVLITHGVGRHIRSFYKDTRVCIQMGNRESLEFVQV